MIRGFFEVAAVRPLRLVRGSGQLARTVSQSLNIGSFTSLALLQSDGSPSSSSSPAVRPRSVAMMHRTGSPGGPLHKLCFEGAVVAQRPQLSAEELPPSAWVFCFPAGLSLSKAPRRRAESFAFVLTHVSGERRYVTCLATSERLPDSVAAEQSFHRLGKDEALFAPRCVCILAAVPCWTFCRKWLAAFHRSGGTAPSVDALLALPLPIPGGIVVAAAAAAEEEEKEEEEERLPVVAVAPNGGLPRVDVPLYWLFAKLGVGGALRVFEGALNEESLLFVSRSLTLLHAATEALSALLFPLAWPFVFISVLPLSLADCLQSPMPFITGMLRSAFTALGKGGVPEGVAVIDLDGGDISGLAPPKIATPEIEFGQLRSDVEEAWLMLHDFDDIDADLWRPPCAEALCKFQVLVQAAFLRFFASLLRGHRELMLFTRVLPKPMWHFSKQGFVSSAPSRLRPFLGRFVHTQMCVAFIENRPWPEKDVLDIAIRSSAWERKLSEASQLFQEFPSIPPSLASSSSPLPPLQQPESVPLFSSIRPVASDASGIAAIDSDFLDRIVPHLIDYSAPQADITQLRGMLATFSCRIKFLALLRQVLEDLRPSWELGVTAHGLIGSLVSVALSEATLQNDYSSAGHALRIFMMAYCKSTSPAGCNSKTLLFVRFPDPSFFAKIDFWCEVFAVNVHNTFAKFYSSKDVLRRWHSLSQEEIAECSDTEWAFTRTAFILHVELMLAAETPMDVIKRLIAHATPDNNEERRRHLLQVLPPATAERLRKGGLQEEGEVPPHLRAAKFVFLWVDDKFPDPSLLEFTRKAKEEALSVKKWEIEFVQLATAQQLKEWLDKFGSALAPKLRVITNRYRKFDGEDTAFKRVIDVVREHNLPAVDILVFCGNGRLVEPHIRGMPHVFLSLEPSGFFYFVTAGKL